MKLLTLIALALVCAPASAQLSAIETGLMIVMRQPDGAGTWRFARKTQRADNDQVITELIAKALAAAHWCESGWEEASRSTTSGILVIEGRCK